MKPIKFKDMTETLQKPESWTDEQCGSLPIATDGMVCVSCWRPTLRERLSILLFGRVWLFVHSGHTQPPVSLIGEREVFIPTQPK